MKNNSINSIISFLTIFCIPVLCGASDISEDLNKAIKEHLKSINKAPPHKYVLIDINNDSKKDAVVLLNDRNYCGSGGCNLYIFQRTNSGFKYISKSMITKPPISLLNSKKHGWNTLVVNTGGIGAVLMEFNGSRYPLNPSLQARATKEQINSAKVILGK